MTSRKIGLYTDDLTERELEVCNLIKKGVLEYKEIAAKLFISETTIKTHIVNIFQKLKVHSLKELVYYLVKKDTDSYKYQLLAEEFYTRMAKVEQQNLELKMHNKNISKLYCDKFRTWTAKNDELEKLLDEVEEYCNKNIKTRSYPYGIDYTQNSVKFLYIKNKILNKRKVKA